MGKPTVEGFRSRELNWPVPSNTRHREYTVTDMCYLIEAQTPCSGCTLVGVQDAEPGVLVDQGLPAYSDLRYKMNVPFVTAVAQREVDAGTNLLTYMGGEPLTIRDFDQIVRWTVKHPVLNGLVYSSSAYFFKPDGNPNKKFFEYEDAGLFSPEFGYFKASVDRLILNEKELPPTNHPSRGDAFKSYHGLKLAELLAQRGHEPAIHQTMKVDNLDQTIQLYEWAKARGIKFSMCPMVWVPYISNGKPEVFYGKHLRSENKQQLQEIVDYLVDDTVARLDKGEKRILVPSSAFTRLIPEYGASNSLSCRVHRQGRQPNGQDIHKNGQVRWCIAQNTAQDGHRCNGCFYIGIDRDGDYWNFEHLAKLNERDVRWLNADVWLKDPHYDPSGRDLFFNSRGEPLTN